MASHSLFSDHQFGFRTTPISFKICWANERIDIEDSHDNFRKRAFTTSEVCEARSDFLDCRQRKMVTLHSLGIDSSIRPIMTLIWSVLCGKLDSGLGRRTFQALHFPILPSILVPKWYLYTKTHQTDTHRYIFGAKYSEEDMVFEERCEK
ncbi:hypothetical protein J3F84DRAFT_337796 [Trichoderma pleuroticola]